MRKLLLLIVIIMYLFLVACQSTSFIDETQIPSNSTEKSGSGYPISQSNASGYPISNYQSEYPTGPDFSINTPLSAGDTVVTGTGPAGVPLNLIDATEAGKLLGTTVINKDGTFQFDLVQGLPEKHQIGIQLGDIEGTDLNPSDFLYSPTYYERPLVGILFDIVAVE